MIEPSPEEEFQRRQELSEGAEDPALREYREAARREMDKFKEKFITPLIELRMLPTDCLLFANSFGWMIGCYCQQDIVRRHKGAPSAKANVSKYVKQYKRRLGLAAVAGQRDEAACENMKAARKGQLKP
jgi:glycogen debranching enzyme